MGKGKRQSKVRERKVVCPDCDERMRLIGKTKLYYCCPECKARLIASPYGKPRGIPADRQTRQLRGLAHAVFEPFSRSGRCSRADSVRWLSMRVGIKVKDCHFGQMHAEQLQHIIDICKDAHAGEIPGPGEEHIK